MIVPIIIPLIVIVAMWMMTKTADTKRTMYSCTLCGARDPKSHKKDCPWKK